MTKFDVPEMSCGHCTAAIEKSIKAVDPAAEVDCDIPARIVGVKSSLDEVALANAIKEAGYDSTALTSV